MTIFIINFFLFFLTKAKTTTIITKTTFYEYKNGHSMKKNMAKLRTYSQYAHDAAFLLGQQIKLARKKRKWSESNLAERAGISRTTLQKIEAGEMSPAIGLVFEVATLVGVCLFENDNGRLKTGIELTENKLALLPKRIREQTKVADDDF